MRKLSFVNKLIFLANNIFAFLLLFALALPYIKPTTFSYAPVASLATPIFIFANAIFLLYWILIGFKRQFILSAFVLILGYIFLSPIYKFSSKTETQDSDSISVMSYNVRKFNSKNWIDSNSIPEETAEFIKKESPDILLLQEYIDLVGVNLDYPYKYNPQIGSYSKSGLAIFSKYPIIHKERVKSKRNSDRMILADILKGKDTVRVYNYHLQSLGLIPDKDYFGQENSEKLVKKLKRSFLHQEEQINFLENNIKNSKHKVIIGGDMNNTAYSWSYKNIKNQLKDTYLEAGNSFGRTYNFRGFPLRIDYLFVDERFNVLEHKNYDVKFSDHYPIKAKLSL